jgi:diguanylate cyclase (GGDEF)-like protein
MANATMGYEAQTGSKKVIWIIAALLVIVLAVVLFLTIQNNQNQKAILEDSIEQQLVASSIAARDLLDPDLINSINSPADIAQHQPLYDQTLGKLRALRDEVGATYIYVLKQIDGATYFAMDTDEENPDVFGDPYELSLVHEQAFLGQTNANILNVDDEWGSFNTGATPIYDGDKVIGIVSTDIEDAYLQRSIDAANLSITVLVVTLVVVLGVLLAVIAIMLRRVSRMQHKLFKAANFDNITSLPNRNYLFNYLAKTSVDPRKSQNPYALLFIDLDNFKSVNDGAGHDAGDTLLRQIASFFQSSNQNAKTFRPDAGALDFSARIGGDEFLQVLHGVGTREQAEEIVQQILDGFNQHPDMQRFIQEFNVGMSIGVALFPENSDDYNVLIKLADVAMYHAKDSGKNRFAIYDSDMGNGSEKLQLTVRRVRGSNQE